MFLGSEALLMHNLPGAEVLWHAELIKWVYMVAPGKQISNTTHSFPAHSSYRILDRGLAALILPSWWNVSIQLYLNFCWDRYSDVTSARMKASRSVLARRGVNRASQRLAAVMARGVVMIVSHGIRQRERQHYRLSFFSCCHFRENTIIANEKAVSSRVGSRLRLPSCWVCQTHAGRKPAEMFISRAPTWLVGSQQDEKVLHHCPSCYCRRKWLW